MASGALGVTYERRVDQPAPRTPVGGDDFDEEASRCCSTGVAKALALDEPESSPADGRYRISLEIPERAMAAEKDSSAGRVTRCRA
jgi:hypothetical protein